MNKLFSEFKKPSYQDWVDQLNKDLKGQPESLIQRDDEVEELKFNSYHHQESPLTSPAIALQNDATRTVNRENNAWENLGTVIVTNEEEANSKALELLNLGVTSLRFILEKESINWKVLTNDIGLLFIHTTFACKKFQQLQSIIAVYSSDEVNCFSFELEPEKLTKHDWSLLVAFLDDRTFPVICANGYAVQQAGATTWQEVAFCLSSAHESLVQLLDLGLSVEKAAKAIHFNVGVGAKYFYEIAKIRALRILWSRILEEYKLPTSTEHSIKITGITGFTNKSLKDPHTNLLRQTTEAMSLIFAGVDAVCVQPYDAYSTKGATKLSTRMAANISLILQEESYLDKVIDPLGGSYVTEYLTNEIADKSWSVFQKIEELGGLFAPQGLQYIQAKVLEKANLRSSRIQEKKDTLIGINIFPNPSTEENDWLTFEPYLGMNQLILEQSIN